MFISIESVFCIYLKFSVTMSSHFSMVMMACVYVCVCSVPCAGIGWSRVRKETKTWRWKQESETEQQHSCKSILRRKPFHALFMLFINALCVVCATINSSKNGCFSDYTRNETFFLFFLLLMLRLFWNGIAQQHHTHPKAKSIHVGCKTKKKIMHTRHTSTTATPFLFLSVLIYTTAHCWVLHFKCTDI